MNEIILRVTQPGVKAVGTYLARDAGGNPLAYKFPAEVPAGAPCTDADVAAEVERLQSVKKLAVVEDPASLGPKGKVLEVDLRWIPAQPNPGAPDAAPETEGEA